MRDRAASKDLSSEVNECPLCDRKFGVMNPKKHCKGCSRVVCSGCSDYRIQLPNMGEKPQRVCEPCYKLRQGDRGASAAETLTSSRQVEASLKDQLREKHQQAENFRDFLVRVSAAKPAGPELPQPSPRGRSASEALLSQPDVPPRRFSMPSPRLLAEVAESHPHPAGRERLPSDSDGEEGKNDAEIEDLIALARRRWRETCADVASSSAEIARLREECNAAERECQERSSSTQELRTTVKSLEASLKDRVLLEAQRDQLLVKTREQQEELEGLTQRMLALEGSRGPPLLGKQDIGNSNSFEVWHPDEETLRSGWPAPRPEQESGQCVLM